MIAKKINVSKEKGTIEVKLSKQEIGRTGVMVYMEYEEESYKNYKIKMFIGVESSEISNEYATIKLASSFTNLKYKIEEYLKAELSSGAGKKYLDFIDNVVRPTYIKSIQKVGEIYHVIDMEGLPYRVEVYDNETIYIKDNKVLDTFNVKQSIETICEYVSNIQGLDFSL